jgi:hypothetical protein
VARILAALDRIPQVSAIAVSMSFSLRMRDSLAIGVLPREMITSSPASTLASSSDRCVLASATLTVRAIMVLRGLLRLSPSGDGILMFFESLRDDSGKTESPHLGECQESLREVVAGIRTWVDAGT